MMGRHLEEDDAKRNARRAAATGLYDTLAQYIDCYGVKVTDTPEKKAGITAASRAKVLQILGDKGIEKLYQGTNDSTPDNQSARKAYIRYIVQRYREASQARDPNSKITMQELLGKEGIKLFEQAAEEEGKSQAFRDAVFLRATKFIKGPKWKKRILLWIGGPSASGKSTAVTEALDAVKQCMAVDPRDPSDNIIVTVDGGNDRAVSQVRQYALQLAEALDYVGVKGIDKYCKKTLGIKGKIKKAALAKGKIKKAALANGNLNLVIPKTFTKFWSSWKIKEYEKLSDTVQIFAEVVAPKGREKEFQKTVVGLGERRAWNQNATKSAIITPNRDDIDYESKGYNPRYFPDGKNGSEKARERYLQESKYKIYIPITNDIMFVKLSDDKHDWVECEEGYNGPAEKMTFRDFTKWKAYAGSIPLDQRDPKAWLQTLHRSRPLVTIWQHGKKMFGEGQALIRFQQIPIDKNSLKTELTALKTFLKKNGGRYSRTKEMTWLRMPARKKDSRTSLIDQCILYLRAASLDRQLLEHLDRPVMLLQSLQARCGSRNREKIEHFIKAYQDAKSKILASHSNSIFFSPHVHAEKITPANGNAITHAAMVEFFRKPVSKNNMAPDAILATSLIENPVEAPQEEGSHNAYKIITADKKNVIGFIETKKQGEVTSAAYVPKELQDQFRDAKLGAFINEILKDPSKEINKNDPALHGFIELAKLVTNQANSLRQQRPNAPIVIRKALNEPYLRMLLLYASVQGYPVRVQNDVKTKYAALLHKPISSTDRDNFRKFLSKHAEQIGFVNIALAKKIPL